MVIGCRKIAPYCFGGFIKRSVKPIHRFRIYPTKEQESLLSKHFGHSHLEKQLVSVITLMKASANWRNFERLFNRVYGQRELGFKEFDDSGR